MTQFIFQELDIIRTKKKNNCQLLFSVSFPGQIFAHCSISVSVLHHVLFCIYVVLFHNVSASSECGNVIAYFTMSWSLHHQTQVKV